MIVALIDNNTVVNVAIVDSLDHAAELWADTDVVEITPPVGIGWRYDPNTDTFTPPPEPPEPEPEPTP